MKVGIRTLLGRYGFILTVALGSAVVYAWTLLRFFTQGTIYDQVGQQVYAQQLLHTGFGDAELGATSYLVKVFFLYIPFQWADVDPRLALIVMTVLVNVVSYTLIAFGLRRMTRLLSISSRAFLWLGLLWLAVFAGAYFWIAFTNSRNIEVAAGVWIVALGLQFIKQPTKLLGVGLAALMAVTFYMDWLQLGMVVIPLLIYAGLFYRRRVSVLFLITVGASVIAFGLLKLSTLLLGVTFGTGFSLVTDAGAVVKDTAIANGRFFLGVVGDGGRLRQIITAVGLLVIVGAFIVLAIRRTIPRRVVAFVAIFLVIDELVYMASGQATNGDTSRYLIMLAPVLVMVIASLGEAHRFRRWLMALIGVVLVMNAVVVGALLVQAWPHRFANDSRFGLINEYIEGHATIRYYGAIDDALPSDYFYPTTVVLPVGCRGETLVRSTLFFPATAYNHYQADQKGAALIVTNNAITNYPNVCTYDDVVKQLGEPGIELTIGTQEKILFYKSLTF